MASALETGKDTLPDGNEKADILEIIKEHGFENYEISIHTASQHGDNYMGSIFAIDIYEKTKDSDENVKSTNELHLIIKCSPRFPAFRQIMPMDAIFKHEIYMYTKYLPEIYKLQMQNNIQQGLQPVAKLYKYSSKEFDEYLIMNNLKTEKFKMLSRKSTMDFDHCELVLKQMGYLHGLAYVLKNRNLDNWHELIEPLKENLSDPTKPEFELWRKSYGNLVQRAVNLFDEEKEKDVYDKCLKYKEIAFETFTSCNFYETFLNDPYSIVIHGDCWTNNILFKYDDNNKPIELRFLDWQLSRISIPPVELSYFMYNCTGTELRKNHFDEFIKIYHNALVDIVKKCGVEPDTCLPFTVFQEQMQKYFKFGVSAAFQTIQMFVSESHEIPEFQKFENFDEKDLDMFNYVSKNNQLYEERMRGVLLHAVSNGFI